MGEMDSSGYSTRSWSSSTGSLTSKKFYETSLADLEFEDARPGQGGGSAKTDLPLGTIRIYGLDRGGGIDLALCQLLHGHGCSICDAEQHRDREAKCFFQRIRFDYATMHTDQTSLEFGVREVCGRFRMEFELNWGSRPKRMCVFVSKYDHVLWDLLLRHKAKEFENCEIPLIISNHDTLKPIADSFGVRFEVFKITEDNKADQEAAEIALMRDLHVDFIVLARYMQILSSDGLCKAYPNRIINIHHSFLPAFVGPKPYHRAHHRGVKLIGATAHYATADLDEGPIIEQDIERASHRDTVDDLVRKGRAIEQRVLVVAVRAHLDDRIIVYGNKTVVFED